MKDNLKPQQRKFCHLVSQGMRPAEAYVKVGYSPNGADVSASKLLKNSNICLYLAMLQRQTESKAIMSRAQMLAELSEIAWNKETRESDRISAMSSLAKLQGMNTEKVGTDISVQVAVVLPSLQEKLKLLKGDLIHG